MRNKIRRGPESPFRVVLRWEDGRTRVVSLSRDCQTLRGAMNRARAYAADVGEAGSLVLEKVTARPGFVLWEQVRVAQVKNSEAGRWS